MTSPSNSTNSSHSDGPTSLTDVLNTYKIPLPHWQRAFGQELSKLRSCRLACKHMRDLFDLFPEVVSLEIDWQAGLSAAKGRFLERLKRLLALSLYAKNRYLSSVLLQPFLLALQPSTCSSLRQIGFHNMQLSKFSLGMLWRIARLEMLVIEQCEIACADGLAALARCSRLSLIQLVNTDSSSCKLESIIRSLATVSSLRNLEIQDAFEQKMFPGDSLALLTQLKALECTLPQGDLYSKMVHGNGTEAGLSRLTNLRRLVMPLGNFNDFPEALAGLTALTSLCVCVLQQDDLSAISTSGMQLKELVVRCHVKGGEDWAPPDSLHTIVLTSLDPAHHALLQRTAAAAAGLRKIALCGTVKLMAGDSNFSFLTSIAHVIEERGIHLTCQAAVLHLISASDAVVDSDESHTNALAMLMEQLPAFDEVRDGVHVIGKGVITAALIKVLCSKFPTMPRLVLRNCDVSSMDAAVLQPLLDMPHKVQLELIYCIGDTEAVAQLTASRQWVDTACGRIRPRHFFLGSALA